MADSKQALLDYIKQNPQLIATFVNNSEVSPAHLEVLSSLAQENPQLFTAPETPAKKGLLENLALGITKPFRGMGEDILGIGRAIINPDKPVENYNPVFLNKQEFQSRMQGDPLLEALKTGAGIGAFAIPGGGSIGQMALKGAVAGGMAGFGGSEGNLGEALKSAGKGAATGGAVGGLFGLGGRALSKIGKPKTAGVEEVAAKVTAKGGDRVSQYGLKPEDIKKIGGYKAAKIATNDVHDTLTSLGLPTNTRPDRSISVSDAIPLVSDDAGTIASASTKTFKSQDFIKSLENKFRNDPSILKKHGTEVMNMITEKGENMSALDALDLKQGIDELAGSFSKIKGDVMADKLRVVKEARTIVRTALGSGVPEINPILTKLSNLYDIKNAVAKYSGTTAKVPGLSRLGINIKVTKAADTLQNKLLNLRKVGNVPTVSTASTNKLSFLQKPVGLANQTNLPALLSAILASGGVKEGTPEGTQATADLESLLGTGGGTDLKSLLGQGSTDTASTANDLWPELDQNIASVYGT
jgi:hypothetical protein